MSDDSYIDSDYEPLERSDGNSNITDSDVDHTTTPSTSQNHSDNSVYLDTVIDRQIEPDAENYAGIRYSSTDSEDDESDWEDEKLGEIEDFHFDSSNTGVKIDINNNSTPVDVFYQFWDNDIFNLFLTCTNNYQKKLGVKNRPHTKNGKSNNITEITRIDLEKFFGLCLLRGQLKLPVLRNAFSTNPLYYHPIFGATMSGRKFERILRSLNSSEGINVNISDRLHKVSTLLYKLIKKFQDSFSPYEALSLDESMLLWY